MNTFVSYKSSRMLYARLGAGLFLLFVGCLSLHAQQQTDSGQTVPVYTEVREMGGYLLDMSLMQPSASRLPRFTLQIPDASKSYDFMFKLPDNVVYSQGFLPSFGSGFSLWTPGGMWGGGTDYLQMGTFLLKNGWRLHTYGEYDKDGWRVPNPSALPWQRQNFKGAFELKSANGAFGVRIEVRQGREMPY